MTKKIPCIVFLARFKDNATFFRRGSFITRQTCAYAEQKKNVCFRLPTVLKLWPPTLIFFMFCFFTINSSRRKMPSVSSLFLLQLILKLTLQKAQKRFVFVAFARFRQHIS